MYRLLHIEADAGAHRTVVGAFADSLLPFNVQQVPDLATFAPPVDDVGEEGRIDALLLSTRGQAEPLASLARLREVFPSRPIIVLADKADLAFARAALRTGAQDVVQLHDRALAVLSRIVLYAIERASSKARSTVLEAEAAGSRALLDGLFLSTSDTLLQTDAAGTIQRASPSAAALIGLDLPLPAGAHLTERVETAERARLQSFIEGTASAINSFAFRGPADTRLLELQPLAVTDEPVDAMRLFRVSELAADFAVDTDLTTVPAAAEDAASEPADAPDSQLAQAMAPPGPNGTPAGQGQPEVASTAERVQGSGPAPGPSENPLVWLQVLKKDVEWQVSTTAGDAETLGLLGADQASAQILHRLARTAAADHDVALEIESLRVKGWQDLARTAPEVLPQRLLVEVSYETVSSRSHFERLLAAIDQSPARLAERFLLGLQGVPKGIYVPTLAKAVRTMGSGHGKPAVQLPDLDTDYRNLVLGHLALMVIAFDDLKRAMARDARHVAAFLAQVRSEGCRTLVRGATGPLAEALRTRLGIDMTAAV